MNLLDVILSRKGRTCQFEILHQDKSLKNIEVHDSKTGYSLGADCHSELNRHQIYLLGVHDITNKTMKKKIDHNNAQQAARYCNVMAGLFKKLSVRLSNTGSHFGYYGMYNRGSMIMGIQHLENDIIIYQPKDTVFDFEEFSSCGFTLRSGDSLYFDPDSNILQFKKTTDENLFVSFQLAMQSSIRNDYISRIIDTFCKLKSEISYKEEYLGNGRLSIKISRGDLNE